MPATAYFVSYHPRPQQQGGYPNAAFAYDCDGKRVKSTVNGVTTFFVGAQRIAMRSYFIPQNSTVNYLLSDHLGSASVVTNSDPLRHCVTPPPNPVGRVR